MMENTDQSQMMREEYRQKVQLMGKKEFTLQKMQEYGFWPKDLPTPYDRQENETAEDYAKRQQLQKKYDDLIKKLNLLYEEKDSLNAKLRELSMEYDATWDYERIRLDVAKKIMAESKERRAKRKAERQELKKQQSEAWQQKKASEIVHIGRGYSKGLQHRHTNKELLTLQSLPILETDVELAEFLGLEYKTLRYLTYHRDVTTVDHYTRFYVPKKKGGHRQIAAPKPALKKAQRQILEKILWKLPLSSQSHGFQKGKSVITSAASHVAKTPLLINMDLENFFPTVTFKRVRGLFRSFGYSGYIASLLAMLCTYCERMEIEVKGQVKYVKTSERILPQGSPASPMITNILCSFMDKRLQGLSTKYGFTYTRYADDMSFSYNGASDNELTPKKLHAFCANVHTIVHGEGFIINKNKTRFLKPHNRQCITGVVINEETLGVPKKWVKKFRATLYNAKKVVDAGEALPQSKVDEIAGMTAWLKSVNAIRYEKIITEASQFVSQQRETNN